MATYTAKPVEVDAMQYTGDNGSDIHDWDARVTIENWSDQQSDENPTGEYLLVEALDATVPCFIGQWVVKDATGALEVMSDAGFNALYEADIT